MKFEYLVKTDVSRDQLNELGLDEWDLVTAVKYTGSTELIFKRPLKKINLKEIAEVSDKVLKNVEKWETIINEYHNSIGQDKTDFIDRFFVYVSKNLKAPKKL